jgi:hypothetical protein
MIWKPRQHVGEPGLWIDIIHFAGLDQGIDGRCALAAGVRPGEGPVLSSDRNHPSILPISGRMLKSFIAGMRFMDAVFD